jgi:signal transduction histidine kinase
MLDQAGLKALLAVPLLREDQVLGTLLVGRATTGEFPQTTIDLLETFAAQSALAIHNARVYQELEVQGRALDAANRHKSEFLANMSHELRTPLNAVIGFSEVLGDELFGDLNEKQAEYVGDIHESGRHLLSLINDILDLSKVEAGHMELDLARFPLHPAIDNALTLVSERAARRGLTLTSKIDELPDEMVGDERKFKQILLNVLSNAIKFTPAGGQVTLTGQCHDSWIEIEIRDTGVGISAEEQTRVFDAFQQAGRDYARKAEGTGLGLTLTRQFVELHGGSIKVASAPDEGSTFTIKLPLEQGISELE